MSALQRICGPGRVQVPRKLDSLVEIDSAAECAPQDVGMTGKGVERIWSSVESLYRGGLHPAITLVLRRRGRIVLKRSIGSLSGNIPGHTGPLKPLHPDSPLCLFSASKAVSALLVHKLVDQGKLKLDDRVADFVPEFAAEGKGKLTLRQLLSHRAGIPDIPVKNPATELLGDWEKTVQVLCAAKPFDPHFERQAYHALTAGFIVGEVVRRVSGRELPDVLKEWIAEPLGCHYLTYGLSRKEGALAPDNAFTGPRVPWPISNIAKNILGVPFAQAVEVSNGDIFLNSVVPAGNIYATADDACRVYQMLLNRGVYGGTRILQPETVDEAVQPVGHIQFDRTLKLPLRFSAGFMMGSNPYGLFGPGTKRAFGHIGFMTVMTWADPSRDISVALLNTGKSVAPAGIYRMARVLSAIGSACPQVNV